MFLKFHLVEVRVEIGLELGETGDKATKRLQKYPDEKRCDNELHAHPHTCAHAQN